MSEESLSFVRVPYMDYVMERRFEDEEDAVVSARLVERKFTGSVDLVVQAHGYDPNRGEELFTILERIRPGDGTPRLVLPDGTAFA